MAVKIKIKDRERSLVNVGPAHVVYLNRGTDKAHNSDDKIPTGYSLTKLLTSVRIVFERNRFNKVSQAGL